MTAERRLQSAEGRASRTLHSAVCTLQSVLLLAGRLLAQEPAGSVSVVSVVPRARAIPVLIWNDPTPDGDGLAELRVIQPMLGGDLRLGSHFSFTTTINFEGATIPEGELALGNWGEGFIDRRHPHTWVHELLIAAMTSADAPWQFGLVAGKGFAGFGTDDPMARPALRYPVNHHWSQLLERAMVLGQVRYRRLLLEGSLFNGDEPESPSTWPNLDRLGDSWAVRGQFTPVDGLELQLSRASVKSPEHRPGAGLQHRQWNASARWDRSGSTAAPYLMVEWARTDVERDRFTFSSILAEGAITLGRIRPYYRLERTDRPEEERISGFRSPRPPHDDAILGISRWTVHTAGLTARLWSGRQWSIQPAVEVTAGRIGKQGGGLFAVSDWYRRSTFWELRIGWRLDYGMEGHRMGRYGVIGGAHHSASKGHP
jgi:hypothetical protein